MPTTMSNLFFLAYLIPSRSASPLPGSPIFWSTTVPPNSLTQSAVLSLDLSFTTTKSSIQPSFSNARQSLTTKGMRSSSFLAGITSSTLGFLLSSMSRRALSLFMLFFMVIRVFKAMLKDKRSPLGDHFCFCQLPATFIYSPHYIENRTGRIWLQTDAGQRPGQENRKKWSFASSERHQQSALSVLR